MKNWIKKILFCCVTMAFAALTFDALAHGFQIGDLYVKHPYSVPLIAGAKNGVAYFKGIKNSGANADQLIAARAQIAERAELHEMKMEGDVMKMRPLNSIDIPAGSEVSFAKGNPNGYHVMLMGLKKPLNDGDKFSVWLTFKHAGEVEVEVWVQTPKDANKAEEHKH